MKPKLWPLLRWPLPMIGLALLAGCAPGFSEPPGACVRVPLVSYSPDVQSRVADEIEATQAGATWPRMIADYGALRAAERATQEACERGGG